MKKLFVAISCIAVIPLLTTSQTLYYDWVRQAGGSYVEHYNGATSDNSGNALVAGTFWSSVLTLDTITLTKPDSISAAMYVAKYSPSGEILWAKMAKTFSYGDETYGYSLVTDENNNVFVCGDLWGDSVAFDNDTIVLPLPYSGAGYIAKYSSDGEFMWARFAYNARAVHSVGVDNDDNLYFSGIDAYAFDGTTISYNTGGVFIAKYSNNGIFQWANKSDRSNGCTYGFDCGYMSNDLSFDNDNNVYLTGFSGPDTIFFNPSKTIFVENTPSLRNLFIVKYDSEGNPLWAKGASRSIDPGVTSGIEGAGLTFSDNHIYVTGRFNGDSISFGSHQLSPFASSEEMFVAKFDLSGDIIWAKSVGSSGNDWGKGIVSDNNGDVYITGHFEGGIIHISTNPIDTIENGNKAMVFKLDANGDFMEFKYPLNIPLYGTSFAHDITIDNNDNIYIVGEFYNKVCFGTDTIHSQNIWNDAFVTKLVYSPTHVETPKTDLAGLKVFPVPASDFITVSFEDQPDKSFELNIFDMLGSHMMSTSISSGHNTVYLKGLPDGVYVLFVKSDDSMFSRKFIISK